MTTTLTPPTNGSGLTPLASTLPAPAPAERQAGPSPAAKPWYKREFHVGRAVMFGWLAGRANAHRRGQRKLVNLRPRDLKAAAHALGDALSQVGLRFLHSGLSIPLYWIGSQPLFWPQARLESLAAVSRGIALRAQSLLG